LAIYNGIASSQPNLAEHKMNGASMRAAIRGSVVIFFIAVLSNSGHAQGPAENKVPAQLKAPDGAKLILHAQGKGDQIYTCKKQDAGYEWTLKAPEALLYDDNGRAIGKHFGGPAWRLDDGSQVTGKVLARVDSPDSSAIPWLLLGAANHSGAGLMSSVASIQRLNTKGGKPRTGGCDAAHDGEESRAGYTADYYFYSAPAGR